MPKKCREKEKISKRCGRACIPYKRECRIDKPKTKTSGRAKGKKFSYVLNKSTPGLKIEGGGFWPIDRQTGRPPRSIAKALGFPDCKPGKIPCGKACLPSGRKCTFVQRGMKKQKPKKATKKLKKMTKSRKPKSKTVVTEPFGSGTPATLDQKRLRLATMKKFQANKLPYGSKERNRPTGESFDALLGAVRVPTRPLIRNARPVPNYVADARPDPVMSGVRPDSVTSGRPVPNGTRFRI